jgi:hypothetical protein
MSIPATIDACTATVETMVDAIASPIQPMLDALATLVETMLDAVAAMLEVGSALVVTERFLMLGAPVVAGIDAVAAIVQSILDALTARIQPVVDAIAPVVETMFDAVAVVDGHGSAGGHQQHRACQRKGQGMFHSVSPRRRNSLQLWERRAWTPVDSRPDGFSHGYDAGQATGTSRWMTA